MLINNEMLVKYSLFNDKHFVDCLNFTLFKYKIKIKSPNEIVIAKIWYFCKIVEFWLFKEKIY